MAQDPYLDSLMARGVVSGKAASRLLGTKTAANEAGEAGTEGPYREWDENGEIYISPEEVKRQDKLPSDHPDRIYIPPNWLEMRPTPGGGEIWKGPLKAKPPLVG